MRVSLAHHLLNDDTVAREYEERTLSHHLTRLKEQLRADCDRVAILDLSHNLLSNKSADTLAKFIATEPLFDDLVVLDLESNTFNRGCLPAFENLLARPSFQCLALCSREELRPDVKKVVAWPLSCDYAGMHRLGRLSSFTYELHQSYRLLKESGDGTGLGLPIGSFAPRPKLLELEIINMKRFDRFTIGFNANVTLLLGKNGSGKTTVLQAIQILADSVDQRLTQGSQAAATIWRGRSKNLMVYARFDNQSAVSVERVLTRFIPQYPFVNQC